MSGNASPTRGEFSGFVSSDEPLFSFGSSVADGVFMVAESIETGV